MADQPIVGISQALATIIAAGATAGIAYVGTRAGMRNAAMKWLDELASTTVTETHKVRLVESEGVFYPRTVIG